MANQSQSPLVSIVVALIGIAGALGGAWITTGAKFSKELDINQRVVNNLKNELSSINDETSLLSTKIETLENKEGKVRELEEQLKITSELSAKVSNELKLNQGIINNLKNDFDSILSQTSLLGTQIKALENRQGRVKELQDQLKKARALNRRVVETYYRWNQPDHFNRHNVSGVDRVGTGQYVIHFAKPFANNFYVALASNTAGFVMLTENKRESIKLKSYNPSGRLEDAEVFFLAYGE